MQNSPSKRFKHFENDNVVRHLVYDIKARYPRPYEIVIGDAVEQISAYFKRTFTSCKGPSRFAEAPKSRPGLVRPRLIVALSGGIDSAVVTALAVKAVGAENVLSVTMPAHPEDESARMSALVRERLGLNDPDAPYVIPIHETMAAFRREMSATNIPQIALGTDHFGLTREQQIRCGNFASRVRIGILYDLQRAIRGRVLGTMNRTEYCQGYGAKFGSPDAYDFGVLNELYKTDIREFAIQLGLPREVLDAAPSTGFFAGQTHEGELGATIEEQDIFVYLLFEKNMTVEQVVNEYGASEAFARTMIERFSMSKHKRVLNVQRHVQLGTTLRY